MARPEARRAIIPPVAETPPRGRRGYHENVAVELTAEDVGDVSMIPDVLGQIEADFEIRPDH
jgi:hypothetical protein